MLGKMNDLKVTQEKYNEALSVYQTLKKPIDNLSQLFQSVANNEEFGPTVIIIPVTQAYVPLAKNFLCFLRALENPPKVLLWSVDNNGKNDSEFYKKKRKITIQFQPTLN